MEAAPEYLSRLSPLPPPLPAAAAAAAAAAPLSSFIDAALARAPPLCTAHDAAGDAGDVTRAPLPVHEVAWREINASAHPCFWADVDVLATGVDQHTRLTMCTADPAVDIGVSLALHTSNQWEQQHMATCVGTAARAFAARARGAERAGGRARYLLPALAAPVRAPAPAAQVPRRGVHA